MSESSDYRDYQRLCDRVEKIDAGVGKWLREEAPKMSDFEYDGDLDAVLFWEETPQGHDFWCEIDKKLSRDGYRKEMVEGSFKPEVDTDNATLAANRAIHDSLDGVLPEAALIRGNALCDALRTINGQRQDSYGNPEDSFGRIALLFTAYLKGKYGFIHDLTNEDVALLMTEMKIARMMTGSGHRDSYIDAAGYIGLAADMGAK